MSKIKVNEISKHDASEITISDTIKIDTISEKTSANGVVIDGVGLKDGAIVDGVTATTQSTGDNSTKLATTAYADAAGGGKILQVVQTTEDTQYSNGGSSYTSVLSTSITPSATTSKVLILVSAHFSMSGDTYGGATLLRGGTEISKSTQTSGGGNANQYTVPINNRDSADAPYEARTISINFLDTPSTTSATTYALGFRKDYGSQLMYNRPNATYNAAYHWNVVSHMTLLEVGA
tara:strand:- start:354 stop:1058 length:705 start_codon:yes stop_codon:yes gene_type:complete